MTSEHRPDRRAWWFLGGAAVLLIAAPLTAYWDTLFRVQPERCTVAESGVAARDPAEFRQIRRPGAVVIDEAYDTTNLRLPADEIHAMLGKDAIPALVDPAAIPLRETDWLAADDRLVVVSGGGETLAAPLRILNWHEVINVSVGGEPVALTYCPLCDSVAVFDRRVRPAGVGAARVLTFGVSGALFNSNVLLYDRQTRSLWSQLTLTAVSGALVDTPLVSRPVRVLTKAELSARAAGARVVSTATAVPRDYGVNPYAEYFTHDRLMVPVRRMGAGLPPKTLGLGVRHGGQAWFVPQGAPSGRFEVRTPAGLVRGEVGRDAVTVDMVPPGVGVVQSFYFAWSAFYPDTQIGAYMTGASAATD